MQHLNAFLPTHTVCVCHRQYVSVIHNLCLSQTVCVCHIQSVSVTHSLFLLHKVNVRYRQLLSIRECMFLSLTVCVCHRQTVSIPYNLSCQLQFVSVFIKHSSRPDFYSFIQCFIKILSLRFQFIRNLGLNRPNFLDPCGGAGTMA